MPMQVERDGRAKPQAASSKRKKVFDKDYKSWDHPI